MWKEGGITFSGAGQGSRHKCGLGFRVVIVVRCLVLPASSLSTPFTTTPDYPLTMSESESEDSLNSDMDIFENESSSNDVGTSESEDAGSDSAPYGPRRRVGAYLLISSHRL